MKTELKRFRWRCDCCNKEIIIDATYTSDYPEGWITTHSSCDNHENHYCLNCIKEAKKLGNIKGNSHFATINRHLKKH